MLTRLRRLWPVLWMRFAGHGWPGRLAMRVASWGAPPYRARNQLARLSPAGFVSPRATLWHPRLTFGANVFIDDRVVIYHGGGDGAVALGDRVHLYADACLETSQGGSLTIGRDTSIHPRCQLMAHMGSIRIGEGVSIAQGCAFYPYDHGIEPDRPIRLQPLVSKGDIEIGAEAWLGAHVVVLAGVRIGTGAVVTAGSLVTRDVPDHAVVAGVPARTLWWRQSAPAAEREVGA